MRDNTLVFWRFKKAAPCPWRRGLFKEKINGGLVRVKEGFPNNEIILSENEIEMVPMREADKEQGR